MARHRTSGTLNDNLRLGRLTLPQWIAIVVGGVSLWVWGSIAAPVRDPNAHLLLTTVPTILIVAPILAFFRGGIERYPQQLIRYTLRRGLVCARRGRALTRTWGQKGIRDATAILHDWLSKRQRRA